MKKLKIDRHSLLPVFFLSLTTLFISCSNDDDEGGITPGEPTIENMEIGIGNNGIGVIGRDFHFEADILAGDLIEDVRINIVPHGGETYYHDWSFEIIWDQYGGVKNTNVHKHFDIPEDAAEGTYDFIITVNDQNGTKLEVVETIDIYHPENLPVDPQLEDFNVSKNYDFFYRNEEFLDGNQFANKDTLSSQVTIGGVKGEGKMYILLIRKSLDHRPETIDNIDFSKVIAYDVFEHEGEEEVFSFSNAVFDLDTFTWIRRIPSLVIGSASDNNTPPNPVSGDNAWANGGYYFGVVYTNTTYNMSLFHYIEFTVEGF